MSACFDYNATTRTGDSVLEARMPLLRYEYGNAASRHDAGGGARGAVRLSFGMANTMERVKEFVTAVAAAIKRLRRLAAVAV